MMQLNSLIVDNSTIVEPMENKQTAFRAFILGMAFLIGSCSEEANVGVSEGLLVGQYNNGLQTYPITVYTIDSCEYIGVLQGLNGDWLSHKGNCKYCKQR